MLLTAIDFFSGCGGLSEGLEQENIRVKYAIEIDEKIANTYKENHHNTIMINKDIRELSNDDLLILGKNISIVAGCPPCQGFTQINRNNERSLYKDSRNNLILEFLRAIEVIRPPFVLMENVPEIVKFDKFKYLVDKLGEIGYNVDYKIVNVANFKVPQNRKRLILVASKEYRVVLPSYSTNNKTTVRAAIGKLEKPCESKDPLQRIHSNHTDKIMKIIKMIPKNGGSRRDLPKKYWLECHKKKNVGFRDVYGRMNWDRPSPTITGGCLSPSKGRFLHPEQNRSITVREALILQGFPTTYYLNSKYPKCLLAQMVGNAIPPQVARAQAKYIKTLLKNKE